MKPLLPPSLLLLRPHAHFPRTLRLRPQDPRNAVPFPRRSLTTTPIRRARADDPDFVSVVDNPPKLIRAGGRKHGWGLLVLAIIPLTALALGTWQLHRLSWKTTLMATLEDRISRPPLPLPPNLDPSVISEGFDYRRIYAIGRFRHDQEMLLGPRVHGGENGYFVITPLERSSPESGSNPNPSSKTKTDTKAGNSKGGGSSAGEGGGGGTKILINRGWIAKKFAHQRTRPKGLPTDEVIVEGMLRKPWEKNTFTLENNPKKGEFYFPDVKQMAELTGSQPVWVEETEEPDMIGFMDKRDAGIPISRAAVVDIRNNHAQYIVTWYGLAIATSIMFYMVVKKPPSEVARKVRMNKHW